MFNNTKPNKSRKIQEKFTHDFSKKILKSVKKLQEMKDKTQ